jgi:hypothetical protein
MCSRRRPCQCRRSPASRFDNRSGSTPCGASHGLPKAPDRYRRPRAISQLAHSDRGLIDRPAKRRPTILRRLPILRPCIRGQLNSTEHSVPTYHRIEGPRELANIFLRRWPAPIVSKHVNGKRKPPRDDKADHPFHCCLTSLLRRHFASELQATPTLASSSYRSF